MTPPSGELVFNTEALVTLGRIEEKVSHLTGLEDRLRKVEEAVTEMRAQQRPRAPWYAVVGAIVGVVSGVAAIVGLIIVGAELVEALATLG